MSLQPGFQSLDSRRQYLDAVKENGSRLATCFVVYTSSTYGDVAPPDALHFTTTFTERPSVGYGCSVEGDDLTVGNFPRCFGGVAKWLLDANGFYVGAWLWLTVDSPFSTAHTVVHDFTFTGVAYKTIPDARL